MPIAALIGLLIQLLPTIQDDFEKVVAVLDTTSAAVKNAQAGDGSVSPEDWAALDAHVAGNLAQLAADAGVAMPEPPPAAA